MSKKLAETEIKILRRQKKKKNTPQAGLVQSMSEDGRQGSGRRWRKLSRAGVNF